MPLRVKCPACGYEGKAPREYLGHSVTCRKCGAAFTIASKAVKLKPEDDTLKEDAPDAEPEPPPPRHEKKSRR